MIQFLLQLLKTLFGKEIGCHGDLSYYIEFCIPESGMQVIKIIPLSTSEKVALI
jgi:hypothetical protein